MSEKDGVYCRCSATTTKGHQCKRFGVRNAAPSMWDKPIWLCTEHFYRKGQDHG